MPDPRDERSIERNIERLPEPTERAPEDPEEVFQDIDQSPDEQVQGVLQHFVERRTRRGAVGAGEVVQGITADAQQVVNERLAVLRGPERSKLDAAGQRVIADYRRERVVMGLINNRSGHPYKVVDLADQSAAGLYKPGEHQIYIDDDALGVDPQYKDLMYYRHVCQHEEWHRREQASVMNATSVRVRGRQFRLFPDLVEGQAVVKVSSTNNQDDRQTDQYLQHAATYREAAQLIGESRLDEAIKSGDILSLQEALEAEERAPQDRAA